VSSRRFWHTLAPGLIMWAISFCAIGQTSQQFVFRSHTPQDYADILSGRYKSHPVDIHGLLTLPDGATRSPAVVIVPGSGGVKPWMQALVAKRLNDVGIATLIIDSFTARGVKETATDQATVPMAASVADGIAALDALSRRPDIDAQRIGITGFSRGGAVAMFTQEKTFLSGLGLKDRQFAAHLPFYPACSTTIETPEPTAAPALYLMGEKDDYTPFTQCGPFIERLNSAGAKVQSQVVPGAHHGWVSDTLQVVYLPRVQTFGACNALIDKRGVIRERVSGATSEEGWTAFATKVWKTCGKYGAHFGASEPARESSLKEMVNFFSLHLKSSR
jgi:dienelactone hydrolase